MAGAVLRKNNSKGLKLAAQRPKFRAGGRWEDHGRHYLNDERCGRGGDSGPADELAQARALHPDLALRPAGAPGAGGGVPRRPRSALARLRAASVGLAASGIPGPPDAAEGALPALQPGPRHGARADLHRRGAGGSPARPGRRDRDPARARQLPPHRQGGAGAPARPALALRPAPQRRSERVRRHSAILPRQRRGHQGAPGHQEALSGEGALRGAGLSAAVPAGQAEARGDADRGGDGGRGPGRGKGAQSRRAAAPAHPQGSVERLHLSQALQEHPAQRSGDAVSEHQGGLQAAGQDPARHHRRRRDRGRRCSAR